MIALKIAIMRDFVAREYWRNSAQKVVGEKGAHKLDQIPEIYPQSTERAFSGILHIVEPVERIDACELLSLRKIFATNERFRLNASSTRDCAMDDTKIIHHYFSATVGWLKLEFSPKGLRSVSFVKPPAPVKSALKNPLVAELVSQLDRYFGGEPVTFTTPLDFHYGTDFQRLVWKQLTAIPYGQTWSYGEVAAAVGSPRGARAVGLANKKNSIAIIIPCHRVINSDGTLGGYDSGLDIKEKLLRLESGKTG